MPANGAANQEHTCSSIGDTATMAAFPPSASMPFGVSISQRRSALPVDLFNFSCQNKQHILARFLLQHLTHTKNPALEADTREGGAMTALDRQFIKGDMHGGTFIRQ